jgi:hypothetical protein
MKAFVAALYLFICLALCTPWAWAGDIVVGSFAPGKAPGVERLAHVEVKGLVAEFFDPGDTGLGKSVAYLLWREILTAISDQAGAGVILVQPWCMSGTDHALLVNQGCVSSPEGSSHTANSILPGSIGYRSSCGLFARRTEIEDTPFVSNQFEISG